MHRRVFLLGVCALLFLWSGTVEAQEEKPIETPSGLNVKDLPRSSEESENLLEFFKRRTQVGLGFYQVYEDNILLQDNKKREDYISNIDTLLFFADPRGSILYGLKEDALAYRYLLSNNSALDHDFLAFFDLDPSGRTQFHAEYGLEIHHHLVFGPERTDIIRRSTKFQESIETTWSSKIRYALNETNFLVPQISYATLDDKVFDNTNSNRNTLTINLDLDHDFTPTWTLFGGYVMTDTTVVKNRSRSSQSNGGRIGLRHPLSKTEDLEVIFSPLQTRFEDGASALDLNFTGKWTHQVNPRTTLKLKYEDGQGTSFAAQRRRFRGRSFSTEVAYELTPLITATIAAGLSKQVSGSTDAIGDASGQNSVINKSYGFGGQLTWQVREQTFVILDYRHGRSIGADWTRNRVELDLKTTF